MFAHSAFKRTEVAKKGCPRLCELAPAARGGQEAESRKPGQTFLVIYVKSPSFEATQSNYPVTLKEEEEPIPE